MMIPDIIVIRKNKQEVKMKTYYLGIDVSKGYSDFIMLDEDKREVEPSFQLDDTFEGHNRLFEYLSRFLSIHRTATINCGLESTGGYENNWYNTLSKYQMEIPIRVSRLNPMGVHYNSKADLKRNTTDKISAKSIAEYLISHKDKIDYNQKNEYTSLRKLYTHISLLVKQKVQLMNELESFAYTSNPEVLSYCKDGFTQWAIKLLREYPTGRSLSKAKALKLTEIPYISMELADKLITNAKGSVSSESDLVDETIIISLCDQILQLTENISRLKKLLEKECNIPEVEILTSFPGMGTFSAVGLIIGIITVERFKTSKKLASFIGVHPTYKQSGDGVSGVHMSKKGRKEVRQILFMVARAAIIHNPYIKEIYHNHLKKGMTKMSALGAIMHKILRIAYGMLKNKQKFNPDIDKYNRDKILVKGKATKNTSRRFQNFDSVAPISRRQTKKRVEREKSQDVNKHLVRDHSLAHS
jgi:transposase